VLELLPIKPGSEPAAHGQISLRHGAPIAPSHSRVDLPLLMRILCSASPGCLVEASLTKVPGLENLLPPHLPILESVGLVAPAGDFGQIRHRMGSRVPGCGDRKA